MTLISLHADHWLTSTEQGTIHGMRPHSWIGMVISYHAPFVSQFKIKISFCSLQEYQWIMTNATVSNDSDVGFIMVVDSMRIFFTILECLKEIGKRVSK